MANLILAIFVTVLSLCAAALNTYDRNYGAAAWCALIAVFFGISVVGRWVEL